MSKKNRLGRLAVLVGVCVLLTGSAKLQAQSGGNGTEDVNVTLILPLGRTVYQTNETIDLALARRAKAALSGGKVRLTLTAEDSTQSVFTFPVLPVTADANGAEDTQHVHINARMLRPGHYKIAVECDEATAGAEIDVFSHVRKSSFRIGDWGSRASGKQFESLGENSLGFNLIYGDFRQGKTANVESAIRGGLDFAQVCTMSGAHQMDLRQECDWSDPYVLGGGIARVSRQAFINREAPNAIGVHYYDEPGLTWSRSPYGGCFDVPSQLWSYKAAFNRDAMAYDKVSPSDANSRELWNEYQRYHLGFLEAAWKLTTYNLTEVRGDFLGLNQSVYGLSAYADGYYFNADRALPVISGHGGYSDGDISYYYPAWTMEYGRLRDLVLPSGQPKPYWYLPSWYKMGSDQYRVEQYMSFINNVQGMMKPPDFPIYTPGACENADGIVEANKVELRLGTIFNEMPVKRPEVAVLYSMSTSLNAEVEGLAAKAPMNVLAYEGDGHTRAASIEMYLVSKLIKVPMLPVVEEDILDGTLSKNHKVLILPHVQYLDANVKESLEAYITGGGVVLVTDDSKVEIKGAMKVGASLDLEYRKSTNQQYGKPAYGTMNSPAAYVKVLTPFADTLKAKLKGLGVLPIVQSDNPGLVCSLQGQGDVDYLFVVNATSEETAGMGVPVPAQASVAMPDDGRPTYDAVHGGLASEFEKEAQQIKGTFHMGGGQMRVFCRPTREIGGVEVMTPVCNADMSTEINPISVEIGAIVVDKDRQILTGSLPLSIQVIDPLGVIRYDLYRATNKGVFKMSLPLAANDPAGVWQVVVRDLVSGKPSVSAKFTYAPPSQCGALVTATRRAVYFGSDRENIFRFFRNNKDVKIVVGTSAFNKAGAERLTKILAPWGVRCTTVNAADVAKIHDIPPEAAASWCGLSPGKPDKSNPNSFNGFGFNVDGPVIVLGNPQDNVLMGFLDENGFLPYPMKFVDPAKPSAEGNLFPGRGRGMIAWQTDGVGYNNQQSITLIAYDQSGMDEAVGTTFEACAGLNPLMYTIPAGTASIEAVKHANTIPGLSVTWSTAVPDRIVGIQAQGKQIVALSNDGTMATIDFNGKIQSSKVLERAAIMESAKKFGTPLDPNAAGAIKTPGYIAKFVEAQGDQKVVACWGGMLMVIDAQGRINHQQLFGTDINGLVVVGENIVVGMADGSVVSVHADAGK